MSIRILTLAFTLMFGLAAFDIAARNPDPVVLIAGAGIRAGMQIGDPDGIKDRWNEVRIGNYEDKDLEYRTNADGRVVLIRCRRRTCQTDRGVRVGTSMSELRQRYGAPVKESETVRGIYLEYAGIGFEVVDGMVKVIYVFARAPG
jgi:hypothetical protein